MLNLLSANKNYKQMFGGLAKKRGGMNNLLCGHFHTKVVGVCIIVWGGHFDSIYYHIL